MSQILHRGNKRILIIDDNPDIHGDFKKILARKQDTSDLDARKALILGSRNETAIQEPVYSLDHAMQGEEGVDMVAHSLAANEPYALAFVDMRMPPGWDGLQTIEEIWKVDPRVEIVICTAYSDYSLESIRKRLGATHRLLVLKKPFETMEVAQLAAALTQKWTDARGAELQWIELEQLVQDRTRELAAAKDYAEKAHRCKSEFLANVSHELRTPMNGVKGMLELLLESPLDAEQKELAALAHKSAMNELEVIEAILDYVLMQDGIMEPAPLDFNIEKHVWEAMEAMEARAKKKGLDFSIWFSENLPHCLHGDPVLIRRALINLVSNAIKFTHDGEVLVEVEAHAQAAQVQLRFSVTDTGVGIPKDRLNDIFESFIQVDGSATRAYMGTGLGLAITKQIVDILGGKMGVKSVEHSGSSFWFNVNLEKGTILNDCCE